MNFKEFIFTEEIHPNDTATVYHRTKSVDPVSKIIQSGFQPGSGATYGKGLYSTISLESQFNANMIHYGPIIVKFHVTNLDKYLVFHPNMAKRIHGQNNYKLSDQLNKFGLDHKFHKDYLNQLDRQQELTGRKGAKNLDDFYRSNQWIQNDPSIKGVIYYGTNDGYCLLKYEPVNDGTITMLGYVEADTSPETMQKLYNNEGWITSTDKLKIKDIQKLPSDRRSDYAQISLVNVKNPLDLYMFLYNNNDLSQLGKNYEEVIINIIKKNSSLNDEIIGLLLNRSTPIVDWVYKLMMINQSFVSKQKMAKLIIKNKKELSGSDVSLLIHKFPTHKQEIAKLIIQYKKELSNDDITTLLNKAPDKQEIAKIIIQNKKELSNDDITTLFEHTPEKREIADLLGEKNIKELSVDNVYNLLKYASNKQEMAKALGKKNINKLSDDNVYNLLSYRLKLQEMAKALGSENINKLSREHVFRMLYELNYLSEKLKIAKMIDQYYTNKTPEIEKLIQPYLQQNN